MNTFRYLLSLYLLAFVLANPLAFAHHSQTIVHQDSLSPTPLKIKDIVVNTAYFKSKTKKSPALKPKARQKLHIQEVMGEGWDTMSNVKITVIDTLLLSEVTNVFLIAKKYEFEDLIYLVQYNKNGKVLETILLYAEDYGESFTSTNAIIKNNQIVVSVHDNMTKNSKPSKEKWSIDAQQKIKKMK